MGTLSELIVVILLIPSYICLAYLLKKLLTYMNGYSKGFNDAANKAIPKAEYEARLADLRIIALKVKHNTESIDTLIDKLDSMRKVEE